MSVSSDALLNLIEFSFNGTSFQKVNINQATTEEIENFVQANITDHFRVRVDYTFTRAVDAATLSFEKRGIFSPVPLRSHDASGSFGHAGEDMGSTSSKVDRKKESPKKAAGKTKKSPPRSAAEDDSEDGDIATPKCDRDGPDDEPL